MLELAQKSKVAISQPIAGQQSTELLVLPSNEQRTRYIMCSGRSKEFPPLVAMRQTRRAEANSIRTSPKAMNSRHRFGYALTRGNQSENKICCQNSHVEAT